MTQQDLMIAVVALIAFATVHRILRARSRKTAFVFLLVGGSLGILYAGHYLTARFDRMAEAPALLNAVAPDEPRGGREPARAWQDDEQMRAPVDFRGVATARLRSCLSSDFDRRGDSAGCPESASPTTAPLR